MTKIADLEIKVAKAEEKVSKCRATIERHRKQLEKKAGTLTKLGLTFDLADPASLEALKRDPNGRSTSVYWEVCDTERKLEDIVGATSKLEDAEHVLSNWRSKLALEVEKERFIDGNAPEVIKTFLEEWKQQAYTWHVRRYEDFLEFRKQLREEVESAERELGVPEGRFPTRAQEAELKKRELDYRSVQKRLAQFAGATVLRMTEFRDSDERLQWLEKLLEQEKKAKMLDLINRINAVVGSIVDANALAIRDGNLNGIVIGTEATAKVETIGAGGWNIQCFHYRTLVHKQGDVV